MIFITFVIGIMNCPYFFPIRIQYHINDLISMCMDDIRFEPNQKQIQFYYRPRIPAASMSIQKYDPNVCLVDFSKNRRFHPVVNNHQSHLISFGLLIYDVWQHCLYSACSQRPMYMCYSHYYLFLVDYLLDLLLSRNEGTELAKHFVVYSLLYL